MAFDWRRNLAALWFAQLMAIFGFSFCFPFLPLYLREVGVRSQGDLALWTGLAAGVAGFSQAAMSPLWGMLADRYGRKSMLLRAMIGGGITVILMGLIRSPVELVILRLIQGATSGTIAAATTLVAAGTPRHRVGWALGLLSSAVAVGAALGPLVGGVAANYLGYRGIFYAGGILLIVSAVPVLIIVKEVASPPREGAPQPTMAILRAVGPGTVGAITVLVICQGLLQVSYSSFQPLLVLRLLNFMSSGVASVTGLTFAVSGICSALAAIFYAGIARRIGFRGVVIVAAGLLGAAEVVAGLAPAVPAIVIAGGLAGLFYGAIGPALSSMIGLETPPQVQATVFGVSSSAVAIGFGVGPLAAGGIAAGIGLSAAMIAAALAVVATAALVAARGREPVQ